MQTFSEFQPTVFDPKGVFLKNQSDWLVLSATRNRDSGVLPNSNFDKALEMLGGEGKNVEVKRFGHWGHGWFEVIIVRPGTAEADTAEEIEACLEEYPTLDDEALSLAQHEAYIENWESWGYREFERELLKALDLDTDIEADAELESRIEDLTIDQSRELFESVQIDYLRYDGDGAPETRRVVKALDRGMVEAFLEKLDHAHAAEQQSSFKL